MINQLLWIEVVLEASLAVCLLVAPGLFAKLLGLPAASSSFWPRLLGGTLAGVALATLAGISNWTRSGLGLGGHIAINVSISLTLLSMLIAGPFAPTWRGRLVLWALALVLLVLALVEIAHAA
jgi:hypothetical protein